jgi:hypothetical protein
MERVSPSKRGKKGRPPFTRFVQQTETFVALRIDVPSAHWRVDRQQRPNAAFHYLGGG